MIYQQGLEEEEQDLRMLIIVVSRALYKLQMGKWSIEVNWDHSGEGDIQGTLKDPLWSLNKIFVYEIAVFTN